MNTLMSWVVCLLPRRAAAWLWWNNAPLGPFAPHVLGRMLGSSARRIQEAK